MPTLSTRIRTLADTHSDGWGIYYRVLEMRRAGEEVLSLAIGEPDRAVAPAILDAMEASARGGHTGYAPVIGTPPLRAALADVEGVSADEIIVISGGQVGLLVAVSAVAAPGETVITLDPKYVTYGPTVRAAGAVERSVSLTSRSGFQPDYASLKAAAKGAKAILINTPNNPTGAVYGPAALEAIAQVAREEDLWVISDEVYAELIFEGTHQSIRDLEGMKDRVIVIKSFSKTYSMTGFRLGWMVVPEGTADDFDQLALATTYGAPGFIQDAALTALEAVDPSAVRALYHARRDAALAALEGARVIPSAGGMYVMLDIRETGLSGTDFAYGLLAAEKVAVLPGESFGQAAAGHVRIALTVEEDVLADACRRVMRYMGQARRA